MPKGVYADLVGQRFGRLLVTARAAHQLGHPRKWLCLCDCGRITTTGTGNLTSGGTQSCGCLAAEVKSARVRTHGMTDTRTWRSWQGMKNRCRNEKNPSYYRYGGRGIQVHEPWLKFENFLADMGERPEGMSLDRIDVNGNYEPSNCQWATSTEQRVNQRPRLRRDELRQQCSAECGCVCHA